MVVVIADGPDQAEINCRPDRDTLSKFRHARCLGWAMQHQGLYRSWWDGVKSFDFRRGCSAYDGDDDDERVERLIVGRGTKGKWCATAKSILASVPEQTMGGFGDLMIRSESDANE